MKLRATTRADLPILAQMNYELIADGDHSNPMDADQLQQRMDDWLQGPYLAEIIEVASEVVGYCLWRPEDEYLYIRHFFIRAASRRQHIGTRAIEALKAHRWPGKVLRLDVLVNNHRARALWQAVGFEEYSLTMQCAVSN